MDMRKCSECEKEFDFDEEGLGCGDIVVCGEECAFASSAGRGNATTIHDKDDNITNTNADGTEDRHIY